MKRSKINKIRKIPIEKMKLRNFLISWGKMKEIKINKWNKLKFKIFKLQKLDTEKYL